MRRIMVVALARKLLIALWRYATTGMVPHGAIVTWTASAKISNSRAARDRRGCRADVWPISHWA